MARCCCIYNINADKFYQVKGKIVFLSDTIYFMNGRIDRFLGYYFTDVDVDAIMKRARNDVYNGQTVIVVPGHCIIRPFYLPNWIEGVKL